MYQSKNTKTFTRSISRTPLQTPIGTYGVPNFTDPVASHPYLRFFFAFPEAGLHLETGMIDAIQFSVFSDPRICFRGGSIRLVGGMTLLQGGIMLSKRSGTSEGGMIPN